MRIKIKNIEYIFFHISYKRELFEKIEKVEINDLRVLLRTYIMPLFSDETSNCLIVCHPGKSESICDDFSNTFVQFEKKKIYLKTKF